MKLTQKEKLDRVREQMALHDITALVVMSSDPHQSEYLPEHWQTRQWLTGFTGSAGTALVTRDQALLWTDFRYWIQARDQIRETGFELIRQGEPDAPEVVQWLLENLKPRDRVAMDGQVVSLESVRTYQKKLDPGDIHLVLDLDLIQEIWTDRPPMPSTPAWDFPAAYAGKDRPAKWDDIHRKMAEIKADWVLMTALDDIAWTFNLRGEDIPANPVNLAFALVGKQEKRLFMDPVKIDESLGRLLARDGVTLFPYPDVVKCLAGMDAGQRILIDPDKTSYALFNAVTPDCRIIEGKIPSERLKAVKNDKEIAHIRQTAVKDGLAMVTFLYRLEHPDGPVTELGAAELLYGLRKEQPDFKDISFTSIMAFGEHSALCHYSATPETDVPITNGNLFLTDSGGNYLTGTTDITRTLHLGAPTAQQIHDYTLVLKGHIAVATALFPEGTKGFQIDTLARQFLWKEGMNFGHGTGHGVGFYLSVHEGPARISPYPTDIPLKSGMLLTNEPGLYREGHYGIRLENMVLVREARETQFGKFMKFESLTLCHFETALMDKALLTPEEIDWVNAYHRRVYDLLSPKLEPKVRDWLALKTRRL